MDLRVSQRERKAKLTQENIDATNALVQERPDITIREIKETLNLNVCPETIRKTVVRLGYCVEKKIIHTSEQERS